MTKPDSKMALGVGLVGLAVTALGLLVSGGHVVATAYLVGIAFWTAIAIGMLMMILIHHIFDSSWSTVLRRQYEHGVAAFPWLLLLFLPLLLASLLGKHDLIWPWMNPEHQIAGTTEVVKEDLLYVKKQAFLNLPLFAIGSAAFFGLWIWISARVRKASFTQDTDGNVAWSRMNAKTAAFGIPILGLTLTGGAIYWFKSLEYHWFSTMYGVWFFANCMRGALSCGILIMVWLYARGDLKGILKKDHLWAIGQLMEAFTVFWAYISFSQYFLIWNANVPEETFWYNIREFGDWWYVSLFLVFGNFLLPFLLLLSYRFKVTHHIIRRIAYFVLFVVFIDLCYNILPALKDAAGNPLPFLSLNLVWATTSVIGVGGICLSAYLRSLPTQKIIPIRDPRIADCLNHHD
jgi:hypothetical protein